jgi:hypothetical protein
LPITDSDLRNSRSKLKVDGVLAIGIYGSCMSASVALHCIREGMLPKPDLWPGMKIGRKGKEGWLRWCIQVGVGSTYCPVRRCTSRPISSRAPVHSALYYTSPSLSSFLTSHRRKENQVNTTTYTKKGVHETQDMNTPPISFQFIASTTLLSIHRNRP